MLFKDRREAGMVLADKLMHYRGQPDVLVLGLPRGGLPVAFEVAQALGAPLDVFVVRKLGIPGHEEFAMGAIAPGNRVMNPEAASLDIPPDVVESVALREGRELERREHLYRGGRQPPAIAGQTIILVDDGLATGSTMRAAVAAVRRRHPKHLVVAVPVGAAETCEAFTGEADEVVCAAIPEQFRAVGLHYRNFEQTSDAEVIALLAAASRPGAAPLPGAPAPSPDQAIEKHHP